MNIISREYKVVLNASLFTGNETQLLQKAQHFWTSIEKVATATGAYTEGHPDRIKSKRLIRFYDTINTDLNRRYYIFRERKTIDTDRRELTLKCRHPDRYIAQGREMDARRGRNVEMKMEEDIKSPYLQLYSFSCSCRIGRKNEYESVQDMIKAFPGLAKELDESIQEEKIHSVYKEEIREIVITGSALQMGGVKGIKAECALIAWYRTTGDDPLIVEFSFRYGNKKERYPPQVAEDAFEWFRRIREHMKDWLGQENATKTGLVFDQKFS